MQTGEKLSVRRFQKKEESSPEDTNLMKLKERGIWEGAPIVNLYAFESDYISKTGPHIKTRFAEQLWLKSERFADERFDRIQGLESGILMEWMPLNGSNQWHNR